MVPIGIAAIDNKLFLLSMKFAFKYMDKYGRPRCLSLAVSAVRLQISEQLKRFL